MYWSTLEAGLALIAACLPTLSYLFNGFSLQSAVRSVRSALSLGSMRSTGKSSSGPSRAEVMSGSNHNNNNNNPYIDIEANDSSSSYAKMFTRPEEKDGKDREAASAEYPLQDIVDWKDESEGGRTIRTVRNGLEAG